MLFRSENNRNAEKVQGSEMPNEQCSHASWLGLEFEHHLVSRKMKMIALSPNFAHSSLTNLILLKKIFIYLILAELGLRCCAQAFSSCSERGPLFFAVRGLLIAVSSPIVEHGL